MYKCTYNQYFIQLLESDEEYIPLEYFDNTEYETRIVHEWLNMDKINSASAVKYDATDSYAEASVPVPCRVYFNKKWQQAKMTAYAGSCQWIVQLDQTGLPPQTDLNSNDKLRETNFQESKIKLHR